MKYLIDTNICIYIINSRPIKVLNKFKNIQPGDIGISAITVSELEYGIAKSKNKNKNRELLNFFLLPFELLDYNEKDAQTYGHIRYDLDKKGKPIGPLDTLIASQALTRNLIIVTNNVKEFKRIDNLVIENWA